MLICQLQEEVLLNNEIKRLPLCEKERLVEFMNTNWGSIHPLINNNRLFEYYYVDGDWTNFYYIEDDGEIAAVCGYIKCSNSPNSDIWVSVWCAKKGKNGIGLSLMGKMQQLTGANIISCNNIRKKTMSFYTFLGYHPDSLNHYYRLNNLSEYKIAVVNEKNIPYCTECCSELKEFFTINEVETNFSNFDACRPRKDLWYINRRYFNYPYYNYKVFGIFSGENCRSLVIFRINEGIEGNVLRLVDYIGNPSDFHMISGHIDKLMQQYNCEFCDCYCYGVDAACAGFTLRTPQDKNIIPNYLNPLAVENTDYYFFTSNTENFMMFKADGDQDRKNIDQ